MEISRFNSTMVRLKGVFPPGTFPSRASFNSTMVRLKERGRKLREGCEQFQFHYGSIKGLLSFSICALICLSFNSTMVRLKEIRL